VPYTAAQVPKRIEFVDALPRNAMGKINKKEVLRDFFS
jgi:non-ribosomal peptide synthetase component E (peptide arylation enzyme)